MSGPYTARTRPAAQRSFRTRGRRDLALLQLARELLHATAAMIDFETLDRCAAYVAARAAVEAVQDAAPGWPDDQLVGDARRAAIGVVMTIAEAITYEPCSPARRRCLRAAMATAIELAATIDVARALGARDDATGEAQHRAGRTIATLGMFFHATAHPVVEEVLLETAT